MREILFRGRRLDNGEWTQGFFFQIWERAFILWGTTNGVPNMIEVAPLTLGQFTGLCDKNGKKIFEGDILDTARWIVTYCADVKESVGMNTGWYIQRNDFESWSELQNFPDYEVIGTIHDKED